MQSEVDRHLVYPRQSGTAVARDDVMSVNKRRIRSANIHDSRSISFLSLWYVNPLSLNNTTRPYDEDILFFLEQTLNGACQRI